jgi:hypothetical protein
MGGACSKQGDMKNAYILITKRERKNHSEDLGIDGILGI